PPKITLLRVILNRIIWSITQAMRAWRFANMAVYEFDGSRSRRFGMIPARLKIDPRIAAVESCRRRSGIHGLSCCDQRSRGCRPLAFARACYADPDGRPAV